MTGDYLDMDLFDFIKVYFSGYYRWTGLEFKFFWEF
jgi:hypothetical protein